MKRIQEFRITLFLDGNDCLYETDMILPCKTFVEHPRA